MMSLLHYGVVLTLVLIVFPVSIKQMKTALDREDVESFSRWVFVASFVAGLPFMVMTLVYS